MPKVSVIMGVYNIDDREILNKSIKSILNQSFSDFEFIICDDGSTDNTLEVVREICGEDKRVKIISNDVNKGLAYVLNKCLKIARGEYIARMDADDESLLNRFEKQVDFLDSNESFGVVQSNANVFDENGIWGELVYNEILDKKDFLKNNPLIHPCVMIRKSAYDLVENYRDIAKTVRVEDYDLFFRMLEKGIKMYTIQEKLFNYRVDKTMASRKKYKYRINEFKIRCEGYRRIKMLPIGYIYTIKPLLIGLLPVDKIKRIIGRY